MPASTYDITIEQGATFRLPLLWKDSAGAPVNLTGCTARMQVRPSVSSPDVLLDLSTQGGQIALGGAAGTITVVVSAAASSALSARKGVYDLEVVAADGTVTRLLRGAVAFDPEVTRTAGA